MNRFIAPVMALGLTIGVVIGVGGQQQINTVSAQQNNIPPPDPNCTPLGHSHLDGQLYPTTIEPEFGVWCYNQPAALTATRTSGANDWVDTFDNAGLSITKFNDRDMGYRVFDVFYGAQGTFAKGTFVNVNHWMIDLADLSPYNLSGGVLVSPDKQFFFENGKLVVEADAAAGSDGMGGADRFYEIDVSPAAATNSFGVDKLYGYGSFGTIGALGCRLERNDSGGSFICSMYDNSGRDAGGNCMTLPTPCTGPQRSGRVWETQGVGTARTASSVQGGYGGWPIPGTNLHLRDVWRMCSDNELDLHCRDRFRMEITKTSIHMFVNGYPAMLIDGLYAVNPDTGADNRIPDSWFASGVRPYLASWINGGQHTPTRWHWDRIAVNPHDAAGNLAGPSASPSFCLGMPDNTCADPGPGGPSPTATNTPIAGATATNTPIAGATATNTPIAVATATNTPIARTATPVPAGGAGSQTLNFDNLTNPNRVMSGQYPTSVVDWGTGQWWLSEPFGSLRTQSVSFNGAGPTSKPLTFMTPKRLLSVDAFNGGTSNSTISLSCAGQPTLQRLLTPNQMATIQTGWTGTCTTLTIGSSNGWDTNFDNMSIDGSSGPTTPPAASQTVDFNNLANPNRVLSGRYPTGVIDWGLNGWYLSGPWQQFTTNSVSFNGSGARSQGFGFISPKTLVKVSLYNGGTAASVVTLSCAGHTTASVTVPARTLSSLTTNWSTPCSTVTVTSSNGWNTNLDNFVIR